MSRIKDALKRAKEARETLDPFAHIQGSTSKPDGKPQTKVINYSEEAVIKHKVLTPYFDDHDLIERCKLLRTRIQSETQSLDHRTILITSSLAQEGKTFIAVNLAITFAREVDQTVLLIDANLHTPGVLNFFGIQEEKGLTDYLLNDEPLSELLIRPGIEKLVILPAGSHVDNSAELLGSHKMQQLVREMKHRYGDRYVFFDAPPVLASVDTMVLSEYVDKILFIIESGRIKPQQVAEALNRLEKGKLLGTILNKKAD